MNLKKFENQELFEQYKQSSEYKEPNVALVGGTIMYNGVSHSSSLEYIDVRQFDSLFKNADINLIESLVFLSYNFRSGIITQIPSIHILSKQIYGQQSYENILRNVTALSIDFNIKFRIEDNAVPVTITIKEYLMGINYNGTNVYDALNACPRLTKEQFYNL